jgi:segregation and condensation protein A
MRKYEIASSQDTVHTIINYNYSIQGQQEYLLSYLQKNKKSDFKAIFGVCEDRMHAIITFLGLLELINAGEIFILQGEGANNFWLSLPE